ncbi:hypothetical protein F5Y16DRAFT_361196 [Xylariaceae sp. FL0255]|nr:hypothetical protein F5Y16DRAFT_361196 [Xylariaceae sp. FL0255]
MTTIKNTSAPSPTNRAQLKTNLMSNSTHLTRCLESKPFVMPYSYPVTCFQIIPRPRDSERSARRPSRRKGRARKNRKLRARRRLSMRVGVRSGAVIGSFARALIRTPSLLFPFLGGDKKVLALRETISGTHTNTVLAQPPSFPPFRLSQFFIKYAPSPMDTKQSREMVVHSLLPQEQENVLRGQELPRVVTGLSQRDEMSTDLTCSQSASFPAPRRTRRDISLVVNCPTFPKCDSDSTLFFSLPCLLKLQDQDFYRVKSRSAVDICK